jgi:hypothetical protein
MKGKIIEIIIFIACLIALFLTLIPKNKKRSKKQDDADIMEIENSQIPFLPKQGLTNKSLEEEEDYIPTTFDKEIFLSWAATYGDNEEDAKFSMYGKEMMLCFAEFYHKAKS